jgi:hypothetical protein
MHSYASFAGPVQVFFDMGYDATNGPERGENGTI